MGKLKWKNVLREIGCMTEMRIHGKAKMAQCLLRESECLSEMNHRWRKTKMVIISKNKMNVWETENVS
jgi:hypothetical protein